MDIEVPGACCGALMFFNFDNEESKELLLEEMKYRASKRCYDEDNFNRTIFAIVSNRQFGLKENLESIGFDAIYEFIGTFVWGDGCRAELTMMVYNQREKGTLPIWRDR
jgi:hypothetical protein